MVSFTDCRAVGVEIILSVHPEYTPDKVKEILIENAVKVSAPPLSAGYGLARLPDDYA